MIKQILAGIEEALFLTNLPQVTLYKLKGNGLYYALATPIIGDFFLLRQHYVQSGSATLLKDGLAYFKVSSIKSVISNWDKYQEHKLIQHKINTYLNGRIAREKKKKDARLPETKVVRKEKLSFSKKLSQKSRNQIRKVFFWIEARLPF